MDRDSFVREVSAFVVGDAGNFVSASAALRPDLVGLAMFEEPLVAFGRADDELYERMKEPEAVGPLFKTPAEWLPGARTVISFFVPLTSRVRASNAADADFPSDEWLHGRIDGQAFVEDICRAIVRIIEREGGQAICPFLDERYEDRYRVECASPKAEGASAGGVEGASAHDAENAGGGAGEEDGGVATAFAGSQGLDAAQSYRSSWSERHVAYICGLGTFSLSKSIITKKGCAGRLGSVVTNMAFPTDERPYTELEEWCSHCGCCARRCPAGAITVAGGKLHDPCYRMLGMTKKQKAPYYGCGKCECGVPCESRIPR